MKINLVELEHQKEAINAILDNIPEVIEEKYNNIYSNPLLNIKFDNEQKVYDEKKFIDIKMETGTGKTYVYTRTMYELNREYGFFKFIIIVPSRAIKEGTKNFIESDYANQHFSKFFHNKRIALHTLQALKSTAKGKRKNIPASIIEFCNSTSNEKNTIQCLLLNDDLLGTDKWLSKNDYDQTLWGGISCPIDAISNTRPIVIIDEPHKFKKDNKVFNVIKQRIKPQMIIRFGATFPEITIGRGKNAVKQKDYFQGIPQYDLNAVEAFNQDLVKGVDIQFPVISNDELNVYKVKNVSKSKLVLSQGNNSWDIGVGEDLSDVGGGFHGDVTYEGNGKLSNDLELQEGMELCEGIFTNSYQEILIKQAIDAHFKKEVENFHRENSYRVKTNALFFIDSIDSYRKEDGWLKQTFERLLKEKLDELLNEYKSGEYYEFLLATKKDLNLSHGGYFAKDWGEPDDSAIAEEVQDILHKERTLPFKKENGEWNIRRFFFSKWTLREGWDNPNIFTICKLRSSGSENSKIQEVGRGLRLPVDEKGNRLSNQEWRLNYIVGWNEREFTSKLIGEINKDSKIEINKEKLTEDMISIICRARNIDEETLLEQLDEQNIIKRNNDFKENGYEKFIELYPEILQVEVKKGKIIDSTTPKRQKVKLKLNNWKKIEHIWKELTKRYMVCFERLNNNEITALFNNVLNYEDVFDENKTIKIIIQKTQKTDGNKINSTETYEENVNISGSGKCQYNDFVTEIAKRTLIPIKIIHDCLWKKLKEFSDNGQSKDEINAKLNKTTLEKIIAIWKEEFIKTYSTKYNYDSLNFRIETSIMQNGSFLNEIEQGILGTNIANDVEVDERNLYEKPIAYDSTIEHEVEKHNPPSHIKVFGKLPRRAIKVPTYTGGSSTPDFIYATEKDGKIDLTLLIETKAEDMREAEKRALEAQSKLLKNIPNTKWKLVTNADEVSELLNKL